MIKWLFAWRKICIGKWSFWFYLWFYELWGSCFNGFVSFSKCFFSNYMIIWEVLELFEWPLGSWFIGSEVLLTFLCIKIAFLLDFFRLKNWFVNFCVSSNIIKIIIRRFWPWNLVNNRLLSLCSMHIYLIQLWLYTSGGLMLNIIILCTIQFFLFLRRLTASLLSH